MITLDASILIAHLYTNDAHHDVATQFLIDSSSEKLIAHVLTLAEVLVGGVKIGRGEKMSSDLSAIGIQLASRTDEDNEPLRLASLRAKTGLKLPDCCVLDTARINRTTLATFDRALARAAHQFKLQVVP